MLRLPLLQRAVQLQAICNPCHLLCQPTGAWPHNPRHIGEDVRPVETASPDVRKLLAEPSQKAECHRKCEHPPFVPYLPRYSSQGSDGETDEEVLVLVGRIMLEYSTFAAFPLRPSLYHQTQQSKVKSNSSIMDLLANSLQQCLNLRSPENRNILEGTKPLLVCALSAFFYFLLL